MEGLCPCGHEPAGSIVPVSQLVSYNFLPIIIIVLLLLLLLYYIILYLLYYIIKQIGKRLQKQDFKTLRGLLVFQLYDTFRQVSIMICFERQSIANNDITQQVLLISHIDGPALQQDAFISCVLPGPSHQFFHFAEEIANAWTRIG